MKAAIELETTEDILELMNGSIYSNWAYSGCWSGR